MSKKMYRSKCCNAEVELDGIPDFIGSEQVCTVSFTCVYCKQPCDALEVAKMGRDCESLSLKAREIFEKMAKFFPPDPWGRPRFENEGRVYDNGWYDLRKSKDRRRLIEKTRSSIGYVVETKAALFIKKNGSLSGFYKQCFSMTVKLKAEFLLLLGDLDFQIETGDIVDY